MEELKKGNEEPCHSAGIEMNGRENGVLPKEELPGSGEKYRTLFTSIDEGFCIIEVLFDDNNKAIDYRFLEVNPAFEKQTGLSDAVGKTMRELVPNHEEGWYERFGEVAISKKAKRFESFASQLAGGVWYDVFAFPYDAEGKNELGILFKDVTERKKTETGLRESEERKSFLLKLNKSVHHLSDPLEVEETITRIGRDYFKTDRCYYAEIENGKVIFRRDNAKGDLPSVAGGYDIADMPRFKKVLDAGEPFVVDDVRSSNLVDETLRQLCIELQIISFIDVPVIKNNEPVGILCLVQSTPRKWTEFEVSLAEEIVEQTWAAAKRVVTEQLLLDSESKLRAIIESSPIAIVYTGRDGEILFRNPRFDLLWGRPPHSTSAHSYSDVYEGYHLDGRPVASEEWPGSRAVLKGELIEDEIYEIVQANGQRIKCWFGAAPVYNASGSISGGVVVFRDITKEASMEQALQENETREAFLLKLNDLLRQLTNAHEIRKTASTLLGKYLKANEVRYFDIKGDTLIAAEGYSEDIAAELPIAVDFGEALLRKFRNNEIGFSDDVQQDGRFSEDERTNLLGAGIAAFNMAILEKEGSLVAALAVFSKQPRRWKSKETDIVREVALRILDTTESVNNRAALLKSEERLRVTVESAVDFAIITTNKEGVIESWNSGAQRMFEYKQEEIVGKSADLIFTDEDRAAHVPEKEMAEAREKGMAMDERWHRRKDGSKFYVSGIMRPIYNPELTGYVKVVKDATRQKLLEQQKDDFIGIASHELKTPLTSIKAYAEFLTEVFRENNDTMAASYMEKLDGQVDRITGLVKALLDTTRISEGQLKIEQEWFNINDLIYRQINELKHLSRKHEVVFNPIELKMVRADKEKIAQVITNFLTNAVKYSPTGCEIVVKAEDAGDSVRVSVRDQGIGIDPESLTKVFNRFFRINTPEVQTFPGMGIGLYIAKSIITGHNGRIGVESRVGEGSQFYFLVPYDGL